MVLLSQCIFRYLKWQVVFHKNSKENTLEIINQNDFLEENIGWRLKWLMFYRLIFSILIISGIYFFYIGDSQAIVSLQVMGLYIFSGIIIVLSLLYAFIFKFVSNKALFSIIQIIVDTFLVTFLIYLTGVYNSVFQFFYLIIIIYSCSLLFGPKPLWIALLVSIQYSLLSVLKYFGMIKLLFPVINTLGLSGAGLFFQVSFFVLASFSVAWLASLLSGQARQYLLKMNQYVQKVERLAHAGEVAAGFAHEIKNPMASLQGSIQLLVSDVKKNRKEDVEKLSKIILRESVRLDNLINDFLYFARPCEGNIKEVKPVNEIKEILKIFRHDKRINSSFDIKTVFQTKSLIEIDSDHFRQIIWNLLVNALDASENSSEILIEVYEKRGKVFIVVEDFGKGILPEIYDKILDPFFSTKKQGTGLGLSIVARLVKQYNGIIEIENKLNNSGVRVAICFNSK